MTLNAKAHQKNVFQHPIKKEEGHRVRAGKAPGRTLSIEHHRGPSDCPVKLSFGDVDASVWLSPMPLILSPVGAKGAAWERQGRQKLGWGSWLGQGCYLVQRHSSVHSSRCSESTGMEGREESEVSHAKRGQLAVFHKAQGWDAAKILSRFFSRLHAQFQTEKPRHQWLPR